MARTRNARGGRRPRRKTAARRGGRKTGARKTATRKVVGGKRRGATRRARGVRRGGQKKAAPLSHHPVEQHTSGKTKGAMKQGRTTVASKTNLPPLHFPGEKILNPITYRAEEEQNTGASKTLSRTASVPSEEKMLQDMASMPYTAPQSPNVGVWSSV